MFETTQFQIYLMLINIHMLVKFIKKKKRKKKSYICLFHFFLFYKKNKVHKYLKFNKRVKKTLSFKI